MALLYLVTLLPYDSLAEKIKAYFVEKMRLQPNITSLDKITAFILSREADELDKRSTQSKANRVNRVDDKVDKVGLLESRSINVAYVTTPTRNANVDTPVNIATAKDTDQKNAG